jgi:predicted nucleotidyltransferase
MRRDDALQTIREHHSELRALGIRRVALFGSTARDEAGPASDIDLLVEFERPAGYFAVVRATSWLEELLSCPVDLVTPGALKPRLRERVEREAIDVVRVG